MIARLVEDAATVDSPSRLRGADRGSILADVRRLTAAGTLPVGLPPYELVLENGSISLRAGASESSALVRQDWLLIGAIVANAVLTVRRRGLECEITLYSERGADDCLARITPTLPAELTEIESVMCAVLAGEKPRVTELCVERPPLHLCGMLRRAARGSSAWIDLVIDDARKTMVADVVAQAAEITRMDRNARAIVARYGVTSLDCPAASERKPLRSSLPLLGAALSCAGRGTESYVRNAIVRSLLLVVLGTEGDSPAAWMRCGIVLQHVLLLATAKGLIATLRSEVVEHSTFRDALGALVFTRGVPQIVVHFADPVAPSP